MFDEHQQQALNDYKEASIKIRYNENFRAKKQYERQFLKFNVLDFYYKQIIFQCSNFDVLSSKFIFFVAN